jgi:predicted O-methyltransferase YrrM
MTFLDAFGPLEPDHCDRRYLTLKGDHWPVELETCEFLYGLVRAIKPENVLECGTNVGYSAAAIGLALKANNQGHLTTLDLKDMGGHEKWRQLGIEQQITFWPADSRTFQTSNTYQLIFLDTLTENVLAELTHYEPNTEPGTIIAIHDALVMPQKRVQANQFLKGKSWTSIFIHTARGLDLMRREA